MDLKYEDLQKLQAVGAEAQARQAKLILRNDLPKAWSHLKSLHGGRVDFVLDNAGFEVGLQLKKQVRLADMAFPQLFTDLIFADFLVSCTPFVKEVVFQCVIPL